MTNLQKFELLGVLSSLPPEKVKEVADFASFLKDRYASEGDVDIDTEWSEEDIDEFSAACLDYFDTRYEGEVAQ